MSGDRLESGLSEDRVDRGLVSDQCTILPGVHRSSLCAHLTAAREGGGSLNSCTHSGGPNHQHLVIAVDHSPDCFPLIPPTPSTPPPPSLPQLATHAIPCDSNMRAVLTDAELASQCKTQPPYLPLHAPWSSRYTSVCSASTSQLRSVHWYSDTPHASTRPTHAFPSSSLPASSFRFGQLPEECTRGP